MKGILVPGTSESKGKKAGKPEYFRKGQVKSVLLHRGEFTRAGLAKGRMMSVGMEVRSI